MALLHSGEKKLLAHFVMQDAAERRLILSLAVADHKTSGPLIQAYRALEVVL